MKCTCTQGSMYVTSTCPLHGWKKPDISIKSENINISKEHVDPVNISEEWIRQVIVKHDDAWLDIGEHKSAKEIHEAIMSSKEHLFDELLRGAYESYCTGLRKHVVDVEHILKVFGMDLKSEVPF